MQCAAATGQLAIAEYLIERGAHIDLVAGYYGSPLQAAALKDHASVVELLLRKGAEPNSQGGFHGMYDQLLFLISPNASVTALPFIQMKRNNLRTPFSPVLVLFSSSEKGRYTHLLNDIGLLLPKMGHCGPVSRTSFIE